MKFKIGDRVSVLDDDFSGIIVSLSVNNVTIETTDGFEMEFSLDQIIKEQNAEGLLNAVNDEEFINEKVDERKRGKSIKIKKKERYQPALEVDLHIHKLLPTTKGMSKHDILNHQIDTARGQLEFAINKRFPRIVFIHGVGEGILKLELDYLLNRYNNVNFYDADYQKYGVGATEVRILQNIKAN